MTPPRSILIRAPNWIGDQILALPFFYHLRKSYPQAHIASACVPWVGDLQFRNLVDEVIDLRKTSALPWWRKFSLVGQDAAEARKLRSWDLGITLPNSFSGAWFLSRSGAVRRRGYRTEGRGFLLNDGVAWNPDPKRHRSQAYLDLLPEEVRAAAGESLKFWGTRALNPLDADEPGILQDFDFQKSWPKTRFLEIPDEDYWILAPGATADSRRWGVEQFQKLAGLIYSATGLRALIVGGVAEVALGDRLIDELKPHAMNYVAQGPICSLAPIFRKARFVVCNESGLAHVSVLCGCPTFIVCGAADPRRTQPLGPGSVKVFFNPIECWPCEKNICRLPAPHENDCLKGITPGDVWKEIEIDLKKFHH